MSDARFVYVDGVKVKLTPEQLKEVANEKVKLAKELNTFHKVLIHYGFKKLTGKNLEKCYQNDEHGWFAEISAHNPCWVDVWAVGKLLPCDGFLGGRVYGTIEELKTVFDKALGDPKLWEVQQ